MVGNVFKRLSKIHVIFETYVFIDILALKLDLFLHLVLHHLRTFLFVDRHPGNVNHYVYSFAACSTTFALKCVKWEIYITITLGYPMA